MSGRGLQAAVVAGVLGGALLGCTSWRAARLYQSGTAALETGQLARARDDLEQAAHLQPDASEIRNHLGLVYWESGDRQAARRAFEQAVLLDCDNAAAQRNLEALNAEPQPRRSRP